MLTVGSEVHPGRYTRVVYTRVVYSQVVYPGVYLARKEARYRLPSHRHAAGAKEAGRVRSTQQKRAGKEGSRKPSETRE